MNWIKTKDKLPENGQEVLIIPITYDIKFFVGIFRGKCQYKHVELIPSFAGCCENYEEILCIDEFSHWIALEDIDQPND